jgi:hypothetical protein
MDIEIDFEAINQTNSYGFSGFIRVADLLKSNCADVPHSSGVYLVLRTGKNPPEFLTELEGYRFKGRKPTLEILERNWLPEAQTIFIGKAETLKSRLRQYIHKSTGHSGGKLIWYLTDAQDLLICWKITPDLNPQTVESQLIQEFKTCHNGHQPFANLRD